MRKVMLAALAAALLVAAPAVPAPVKTVNVDVNSKVVIPDKPATYRSIEGLIHHFELIMTNRRWETPVDEVYGAVESPNGELGFYIVSTGGGVPAKVHVRAPSFVHMGGMHTLLEGYQVADIVPTFGSMNMIGGECDR